MFHPFELKVSFWCCSSLFFPPLLKVPSVVRVLKACSPSFSAPIKSLLAESGLHSASCPFPKSPIHRILFLSAPGIAAPSSQTQMVQNWVIKARWPYAAILHWQPISSFAIISAVQMSEEHIPRLQSASSGLILSSAQQIDLVLSFVLELLLHTLSIHRRGHAAESSDD